MEASIPAIINGLKEVAKTIGKIIIEEYKKKPVEKDLEQLYKSIKYYYEKALQLKRGKDNAEELAERIRRDSLFFLYVTNEKAEKIVNALDVLAILSNKEYRNLPETRQDRIKIVYWILKCLEAAKNISIQQR